ncbi:MAG: ATP-grasp domain-containing protein [Clostridiales bacterium]|nr:ATP-grasp domain-containing protein [Candidatus Equinaster intestinalis]
MKILFTSVGRRVELMQAFKSAAEKTGIELELWGADISGTAPALFFCDKQVIVPKIKDAQYIPVLQEICKKNKIDALIPTIDTDLLLLSQNAEDFGDTKVLVSSPKKIKICRDKRLIADYFMSVGLKSPKPVDDWTKYDGGFPAFIKPKDGSSSIFAYKVNSKEDLESFAKQVPDYIIQPFITGEEFTVDALCDLEGNPILITPRIRTAVRSGEVLKTQICQDEKIIAEMKQLLAAYKPCGQITVQLIRERSTGDDYYIEINPRFGGGAPLSIKAGADSAEMVLRFLNGEKLEYIPGAAEDGALFSRFDQSIRVK